MKTVYNICYCIIWPAFKLLYRIRTEGRENIPTGAAVVCSNHSSMSDPFLIALAFTRRHQLHFMSKIEIKRWPVVGWILEKAGVFYVDRGKSDVSAIKTALKYLRGNRKIMMFPEGTRIKEDEASDAKKGAIMLAMRTGSPVVPVYVPKTKKLFHTTTIVIGAAYNVAGKDGKAAPEDYRAMAAELMDKINSLKPEHVKKNETEAREKK